jgi:hypothetical protein
LESQTFSGTEKHQLEEIDETRSTPSEIQTRSPVLGLLITRNLFKEQRLKMGDEVYQIADLIQVRILEDLLEKHEQQIGHGD